MKKILFILLSLSILSGCNKDSNNLELIYTTTFIVGNIQDTPQDYIVELPYSQVNIETTDIIVLYVYIDDELQPNPLFRAKGNTLYYSMFPNCIQKVIVEVWRYG